MSEYINSTQGSPLSLRLNIQRRLSPEWLSQTLTGRKEPVFFLSLDIDGRLIPVFSETTIESVSGSINFIPNIIAVLPSGDKGGTAQEDNFIMQASLNLAYVPNKIKEALAAEGSESSPYGNFAVAAELRLGNYSRKKSSSQLFFFLSSIVGKSKVDQVSAPV